MTPKHREAYQENELLGSTMGRIYLKEKQMKMLTYIENNKADNSKIK